MGKYILKTRAGMYLLTGASVAKRARRGVGRKRGCISGSGGHADNGLTQSKEENGADGFSSVLYPAVRRGLVVVVVVKQEEGTSTLLT